MSRYSNCLLFLPFYTSLPCLFTYHFGHYTQNTFRKAVQEDLCAISCNQNTLCLECELHPEIRSFLPNGCVMPHRVVDRGFLSHISNMNFQIWAVLGSSSHGQKKILHLISNIVASTLKSCLIVNDFIYEFFVLFLAIC